MCVFIPSPFEWHNGVIALYSTNRMKWQPLSIDCLRFYKHHSNVFAIAESTSMSLINGSNKNPRIYVEKYMIENTRIGICRTLIVTFLPWNYYKRCKIIKTILQVR